MLKQIVSGLLVTLILFSSCAIGIGFALIFKLQPDFSRIVRYTTQEFPSIVLDDEGNELFRFFIDRRAPIMLSAVPDILIKAFLAAEDHQFFDHHGLSYKGMLRSLVINCYYRRAVQGASTITQQLVKLLFLHNKKTFMRKLQEQWYALLIEQQYSKEQILQAYLNNVYFGCGIYGIQEACQRFWGICVTDISVDQAALLAGIVRSPNKYCPLRSTNHTLQRRNVVLRSMKQCGYITEVEYDSACALPVIIEKNRSDTCASHIKEWLRQILEKQLGKKALYTGGYIIQTTLNGAMQQQAQKVFHDHCTRLRAHLLPTIDGGLITIRSQTGAIKALVGGYDFAVSQLNRALYVKRQIGSTIKPLIFAAAEQQGIRLYQTEVDEPFTLTQSGQQWSPQNYNKKFNGIITRAYALAHSNNIVTIKTLLQVGAQKVVDLLAQVGITHHVHTYPSLALGCIDATLKELVGMFNIFANDGTFVEPFVLSWIKDRHGCKIWQHAPRAPLRVLPSRVVGAVSSVLQYSFEHIYHKRLGSPVISKTGTTNDSRTCFFLGATPTYSTAVYVGCDDNRSLGNNVFPIHTTLPIWLDFYNKIADEKKSFMYDPSLQKIYIHKRTGQFVQPNDVAGMALLV